MAKNLIIVESPAKVKTIKKFLGRDYAVEASVGHVRDLPTKTLGVDESKGFEPEYGVIPGKQKVVTALKKAAEKAEHIFLAPDPDREGEAIAWHVAELLKPKSKKTQRDIRRIQFNEITSRAVQEALEHPRELDEKLFHSQQARRILDRLVGYKLSPLLWKKVKRGISAGRVQSVALRLVVDREKERQAFVPEEYWVFKARVEGPKPPPFGLDLWKIDGKKAVVGSGDEAGALRTAIEDKPFSVASVEEKERKRSPLPPFITSTLQQDASRRMGYPAKKTMRVAQRLYEGVELGDKGTTALITYMRTDSVRVASEARDTAREVIISTWGKEYAPAKPRAYRTKSGAQDAHEAIRPVDPSITPDSIRKFLPNDQYKLYRLIWQRFMASQMAPARFWDTVVIAQCEHTLWRAKGERLLFPGFLAAYGREDALDSELPELTQGDPLEVLELSGEQKFTQPPARYNEASLVKELEDKGIGRPSTYAAIISTLLDRDYARLDEKRFVPTELGVTVAEMLTRHFTTLMDIGFTAEMEERLDRVADGEVDWVDLLRDFTGDFYPTLDKAQTEMEQVKGGKETDQVCELCGKPMIIRFGRMGEFLGCSGYPDCRNIKDFNRDEQGNIRIVEKPREELEPVGTCPDCGKDLVIKRSRTGSRFVACTGYPECKHSEPYSTGIACPQQDCPGRIVEKSSRRGKVFYACDQFPRCEYALWDWPVPGPCPECGSRLLVRKNTKSRGEFIACPEKGCRYTRSIAPEGAPEDAAENESGS